ncbi:MAG: AAA family ATPase [Nitrospiraceae bacterium]|nr:MAG: AAA family ATPase [Nitrospiraceae bacterium]
MYREYFDLEELPFSIAPDPRYLFMSEQHREALAHLIYGFNGNGGFVLLTGEVGTGKTTVCRCFLEQIPKDSAIAFIINPKLTVDELLATICDEFGLQYPASNAGIKVLVDLINAHLLEVHAKGKRAVLIIDEAQNLSSDVLEQLRLLTNLETNHAKLLQIILLGQPELRDKLSKPELRQLSQRIIARYHLGPLSEKDVTAYIVHRLTVAGLKKRIRRQLFTGPAIRKLYKLSGGVPRLINVLCDRAMLGTFAQGRKEVGKSTLTKAAHEVFGNNGFNHPYQKTVVRLLMIITPLIVGAALMTTYYIQGGPNEPEHKAVDGAIAASATAPGYDNNKGPYRHDFIFPWLSADYYGDNIPGNMEPMEHTDKQLPILPGSQLPPEANPVSRYESATDVNKIQLPEGLK